MPIKKLISFCFPVLCFGAGSTAGAVSIGSCGGALDTSRKQSQATFHTLSPSLTGIRRRLNQSGDDDEILLPKSTLGTAGRRASVKAWLLLRIAEIENSPRSNDSEAERIEADYNILIRKSEKPWMPVLVHQMQDEVSSKLAKFEQNSQGILQRKISRAANMHLLALTEFGEGQTSEFVLEHFREMDEAIGDSLGADGDSAKAWLAGISIRRHLDPQEVEGLKEIFTWLIQSENAQAFGAIPALAVADAAMEFHRGLQDVIGIFQFLASQSPRLGAASRSVLIRAALAGGKIENIYKMFLINRAANNKASPPLKTLSAAFLTQMQVVQPEHSRLDLKTTFANFQKNLGRYKFSFPDETYARYLEPFLKAKVSYAPFISVLHSLAWFTSSLPRNLNPLALPLLMSVVATQTGKIPIQALMNAALQPFVQFDSPLNLLSEESLSSEIFRNRVPTLYMPTEN